MFSKYEVQARHIPTLICSLPFLAIGFYYINHLDSAFWQSAAGVSLSGLTMGSAFFTAGSLFCRNIGKYVERRMFSEGRRFPTTEFLMTNNSPLTEGQRHRIIMKIQSNFGIDISAKPHRQSIHEAVGQIKASLRDNRMVLQRNIQYGMARNIFGGSIAAIVASAVLVTVSLFLGQKTAIHISIALLIFYSLLGLAAYRSIRSAANDYAHMLYDEFLAN